MIIEIKGDITNTGCKLIAHGVNCQGVMGSGVAKAIYTKWPEVKAAYLKDIRYKLQFETPDSFLGKVQVVHIDKRTIANCFTQQNFGTENQVYLNYHALDLCLQNIKDYMVYQGFDEIAIPKIGCGLAGGNWVKVKQMLYDRFKDSEIKIYVYSLD